MYQTCLFSQFTIFYLSDDKSRTQWSNFLDLLLLLIYIHKMNQCLFGKLLRGKTWNGLNNLALYVLSPTDSSSQFVSTESCSADLRTLFIKTQPRGLLHTLNTDTVTYKEVCLFFLFTSLSHCSRHIIKIYYVIFHIFTIGRQFKTQ